MHTVTAMSTEPRAVALLALLLALAACGGGGEATGSGTPTPNPPAPPTDANAVRVEDNLFNPGAVATASGTAVTWSWAGAAPHNVTFEDGVGSSATQTSGTHTRSFPSAGTYRYRCTIHSTSFSSGMVGAVTIR